MDKAQIDRINELARKKKAEGLTAEEEQEQAKLRRQYLDEFKASFSEMLENTYIQRPDGSKEKIRKKVN